MYLKSEGEVDIVRCDWWCEWDYKMEAGRHSGSRPIAGVHFALIGLRTEGIESLLFPLSEKASQQSTALCYGFVQRRHCQAKICLNADQINSKCCRVNKTQR